MASGSNVLQLDKSRNAALNFTVLKRIDPEIEEIIASSNFCVIYEFSEERGSWNKKNIEGPLFIVKRGGARPPRHRVWVLNRAGRQNLVQDVGASLELSVKQGFYIFRDALRPEQGAHAIWFPDEEKEAGTAVVKALDRIVKAERKGAPAAAGAGGVGGAAAGNGNSYGAGSARAGPLANSGSDWTGGEQAGRALLALLQRGTAGAAGAGASGEAVAAAGTYSAGSSASSATGSSAAFAGSAHSAPSSPSPFPASASIPAPVPAPAVAAFFASAAPPQPPLPLQPQPALLQPPQGSRPGASAAAPLAEALAAAATAAAVGASGAGASGAAATPLSLSKQQLRALLLDMVSEDAFVDLLHARYMAGLAARRAAEARAASASAAAVASAASS